MSQGPPTSGGGVDPQQPAAPAQPAVPAGWYAHPSAPGWEAYWDGNGWGVETRPAQAAVPAAAEAAPAAEDPAAAQQAYADPAAAQQQQAYADPAAAQQEQQPYADPAASQDPAVVPQDPAVEQQYVDPATAVQAQQPNDPQAAQYAQEQPVAAMPSAAAAGTAAAAAPAAAAPASTSTYDPTVPAAESTRSESSLPLVLCLLGAIVAIVGCFLPMASVDDVGVEIADNTLFAASYGIAVIALAVLAAGVAAFFYLKGKSSWIVVLLGVVIVGIAAYVGLAGLDDLDRELPPLPPGLNGADQAAFNQAVQSNQSATGVTFDGTPSTGIFAVGAGGLLLVLGGIGISRQPK